MPSQLPSGPRKAPNFTETVASRFFIQYYGVELLFGVPNHFGVDDETALEQFVDIVKYGMFKPPRR